MNADTVWTVIVIVAFLVGVLSSEDFREENRRIRKEIEKILYKRHDM